MIKSLEIIKAGAAHMGLRLIGDDFIGYRFVPRGDAADSADSLLQLAISKAETDAHIFWLRNNRDGDYSSEEWSVNAQA